MKWKALLPMPLINPMPPLMRYFLTRTAWLKCHYPKEYMAALLTSVLDNANKVAIYNAECNGLGIRVLPPHVNTSETFGFTAVGSDIRFGLLAVKNLGRGFIDRMIEERTGESANFPAFIPSANACTDKT